MQRTTSTEKSPVDVAEKSSVEGSRSADEQAPALDYATPAMAPKPKLPYGWQFAMILLTCMCTCTYPLHSSTGVCADRPSLTVGNHWSNVSLVPRLGVGYMLTFFIVAGSHCVSKALHPLLLALTATSVQISEDDHHQRDAHQQLSVCDPCRPHPLSDAA